MLKKYDTWESHALSWYLALRYEFGCSSFNRDLIHLQHKSMGSSKNWKKSGKQPGDVVSVRVVILFSAAKACVQIVVN